MIVIGGAKNSKNLKSGRHHSSLEDFKFFHFLFIYVFTFILPYIGFLFILSYCIVYFYNHSALFYLLYGKCTNKFKNFDSFHELIIIFIIEFDKINCLDELL